MTFRSLRTIFLTGLAIVLPVVVTVWIVWWFGETFETSLGAVYKALFSPRFYFPGLGLLLGVVLIFVVGLLAKAWLFRSIFDWWGRVLNRIPLVKTVYGAAQDFMNFLSGETGNQFNRVVLVTFEQPPMKLMGFVTREDFEQFPGMVDDDEVAVFLPMSYQVGGYTLFLPRAQLQAVDIRADDAMRFVLTAGLSARNSGPADKEDRAAGQ